MSEPVAAGLVIKLAPDGAGAVRRAFAALKMSVQKILSCCF